MNSTDFDGILHKQLSNIFQYRKRSLTRIFQNWKNNSCSPNCYEPLRYAFNDSIKKTKHLERKFQFFSLLTKKHNQNFRLSKSSSENYIPIEILW